MVSIGLGYAMVYSTGSIVQVPLRIMARPIVQVGTMWHSNQIVITRWGTMDKSCNY